MRYAIAMLILLAACSKSPAGPGGLDPTVAFYNFGPYAPIQGTEITFVWRDASDQVQTTSIPWGSHICIKFTSTLPTDSVRYEYFAGDTTGNSGQWFKASGPWFNPQTGVASDAAAYPNGAEYWWFDFTKNPYVGTQDKAPC